MRVKFSKPWRGHLEGAIAEITEERASELIAGKFCVPFESEKVNVDSQDDIKDERPAGKSSRRKAAAKGSERRPRF